MRLCLAGLAWNPGTLALGGGLAREILASAAPLSSAAHLTCWASVTLASAPEGDAAEPRGKLAYAGVVMLRHVLDLPLAGAHGC